MKNATSTIVYTPLMFAVFSNANPEVITALLELGADPKAKDNSGKMAIDYVKEKEKFKDTDALRKLNDASF